MAATPSAAPQDAGPHRPPAEAPYVAPRDWAENYVPTEAEKARERAYVAKRAREKAWQDTPASEPF